MLSSKDIRKTINDNLTKFETIVKPARAKRKPISKILNRTKSNKVHNFLEKLSSLKRLRELLQLM